MICNRQSPDRISLIISSFIMLPWVIQLLRGLLSGGSTAEDSRLNAIRQIRLVFIACWMSSTNFSHHFDPIIWLWATLYSALATLGGVLFQRKWTQRLTSHDCLILVDGQAAILLRQFVIVRTQHISNGLRWRYVNKFESYLELRLSSKINMIRTLTSKIFYKIIY